MNIFKEFWKANNGGQAFEKKEGLTKSEIVTVQNKIAELQSKGYPSSKIIHALQKMNDKLSEEWKAARAYWTEVKRDDTLVVAEAGDDIGISKYKVVLSPNACKLCRNKTENGQRIFKQQEMEKAGHGHAPPFHPNCFCIAIPHE